MAIKTVCISIIEIIYDCCRILKGVGFFVDFVDYFFPYYFT